MGGNVHGASLLAFSCTAHEMFCSFLLVFWKNCRSLFYITVCMRLSANAGAPAEAELFRGRSADAGDAALAQIQVPNLTTE